MNIISNIFYTNLKKVANSIIKEYPVDKMHSAKPAEVLKRIEDLYQQTLPDSRNNVLDFFKLEDIGLIKNRTLLRVYPHFLIDEHEVKQVYFRANKELKLIEKNMAEFIFPTEFIDQGNVRYCDDILDEKRDLDLMLKETVNYKDILSM